MNWFDAIGPLGFPLIALSCIGLALIIERLFFFLCLPAASHCNILKQLEEAVTAHKHLAKTIRDEFISVKLIALRDKYYKGIHVLRLIAVISPMLGLLGTVIGIIDAFKVISLHDGPVYPALIADGLWTAMLTTAVGLTIALPCLLAAFAFSRIAEKRIHHYQHRLNRTSLSLEGVSFDD